MLRPMRSCLLIVTSSLTFLMLPDYQLFPTVTSPLNLCYISIPLPLYTSIGIPHMILYRYPYTFYVDNSVHIVDNFVDKMFTNMVFKVLNILSDRKSVV